MTGQRDIERTLDAWFVDGPTVMPDRLFDAVLDQVARTRQQPLARLRLRLTEMNPRIRLYTALAAALLVVVAAIAVIGGGSRGLTSASPSPNPTASPAAGAPAELLATWLGGPHTVPGNNPDAGVTLEITNNGFLAIRSDTTGEIHFQSRVERVDSETIQLITGGGVSGCTTGDAGSYTWSLSASGETLELAGSGADGCATRGAAVPGTYSRVDCRIPEDNCLGTLEPGTNGSQFFDPFAASIAAWTPRYGVVTYTVPAGWANAEDFPSTYSLLPKREYDTYDRTTCGEICPDAITLLARASAAEQGDTCEARAEPGVGRTATELLDWLTTLPGLVTSTEPVTIDGVAATAIDIEVAESWTGTCAADPPLVGFPLLTEVGGWHWAIFRGDRYRAIPLDLGGGETVVIFVDTRDASTFDAFLAEAMPIVDSLDFRP